MRTDRTETLDELKRSIFQGMDPSAPLENYAALDRLVERARQAERKWHNWHLHTGTYGITCPACRQKEEPT